ncbi:acyltransferase [Pseudomonas sp. J452]|uniref:acyltransferase family protein n=1 Tax=Pseudomonas sp. J452 TaxID=2898441 RepID=UPI0021ADA15E|nr:acyltransferase [Pseudomonas sp. J452]UUY09340.1 acyltransferase [Pseudomonas sp. J452]
MNDSGGAALPPSTAQHKRLGQLDDLRAIAITLVVVMHGYAAFFSRPSEMLNPLLIFIYAGGTGVTLFFILSGYLVSMPFILAGREGRSYSTLEHFKQRALRILPTYYFYVFISCLVVGSFEKFIPALLFLVSGNELSIYSNVWWSLATEVQFYLLVPLLFALKKRVLLVCGVVWALLYFYCAHFLIPGNIRDYAWITTSLLFKAPAFFVGAVIALIVVSGRLRVTSGMARLGLFVVFFALLTLLLQDKAVNDRPGYAAVRPFDIIPEALLWGCVFFLFLQNSSTVFGVCGHFLAKISFSLYLVHYPIVFIGVVVAKSHGAVGSWERYAAFVATLLLSIILAWVSFKLVEEPFLRLKNRARAPRDGLVRRVLP